MLVWIIRLDFANGDCLVQVMDEEHELFTTIASARAWVAENVDLNELDDLRYDLVRRYSWAGCNNPPAVKSYDF